MLLMTWPELEAAFHLLGYRPGREQRAVHEALLGQRLDADANPLPALVVLAGGEQAGKSWLAAHHIAVAAAATPSGIFWLIGNRYEDAKREYQYALTALLKSQMTKKGMYSGGEVGPWQVKLFNGSVIKTLASEDVTVLAREAPDGVELCEPGRQTFGAFEASWRRLVPKTAWMLVAGTFENDPERWYPDLFTKCLGDNAYGGVARSLPTYANPELYPGGVKDTKFLGAVKVIRAEHPTDWEEIVGERFLGRPRRPQGLVFSEFGSFTHVRDSAEYDEMYPVYLAIDPGWFPSAYAILFCQFVGDQIRVFDELYLHKRRALDVITMVKNHPSYPKLSGIYIDIASTQHTNAQDSHYETWTAELAGEDIPIMNQYVDEKEGRNRLHDKLATNPETEQPYLVVHPRCLKTIAEFQKGYKYHQRTDGTFHNDEPIDENNHAIKALTYLIVGRYGMADRQAKNHPATVRRSAIDLAFARRR